jgi:hypothetical protein
MKQRRFTRATSSSRASPSAASSSASAGVVGRPRPPAKSFAVPSGNSASAGPRPIASPPTEDAAVSPFTTSLMVPSPPAATTTSQPPRAAATGVATGIARLERDPHPHAVPALAHGCHCQPQLLEATQHS